VGFAKRKLRVVARVLRILGAVFLAFWLLALSCSVAYAQAVPPLSRLLLTREAAASLDSLASRSRDERVETAGCVTAYSVRDSLLTIERIGPASYLSSDSTTIRTDSAHTVCPIGVPNVHSHVAFHGWPEPSQVDQETQRRVGVWCLLLSVLDNGWRVVVYGRRGETP